jgi:tetratricopeptide (TPR) repeat protein
MQHILLTMMFVFGGLAEHNEEYLNLRKASLAEYEMGRFPQAETLAQQALLSAEKANDQYGVAIAYSALGNIYQAQSRFVDAERIYQKAISKLNLLSEHTHALAILWRSVSTTLTAQIRYDEALRALNKASQFLSRSPTQDPQLRVLILNGSGVVQFYQGKMNKAQTSFLRAAQSEFRPTNAQDIDLPDVLNNLGRVYQSKHDYVKAEDAYKRSVQLMTARHGPAHPNLSAPLNNAGALYRDMGRYKESEAALQQSLTIHEQLAKPTDQTALMHTLYELAKTYICENEKVRAEVALARASELARTRHLSWEMPEAFDILETYSALLKDRSNPDAQRLHAEAQRIRATLAFTVPLANAK